MKNRKRPTNPRAIGSEGAIDGGGIGLIIFCAVALWLLLFQSNLFR